MKKDIIAHMRSSANMTAAEAENALEAVAHAVSSVANTNGSARIPGFGTFKVKDRAGKVARNPRTGEAINVPARRVMTFKEAKGG